jgi:short subunit dehydrogenase-like uncharacterized protein
MRDLDLVVFGATGFTGKLVADYIAARNEPIHWAIAGRNKDKLEAIKPNGAEVIVADAHDEVALRELAGRTRAVCTTVGPYAKYGSALVAACANEGTHYCDLTGEVHWMRAMIDAHHARARQTGARIVHTCGFDSIPSDLGTWCAQRAYIDRYGRPAAKVTGMFRLRGEFSGGTIATMMNVADELSRDPALRKVLGNPYALDPEPQRPHPKIPDVRGVGYDDRSQRFTVPFVMASCNTRVVRRAHALAGFPWGEDFAYDELMTTGGLASAVGITAGLAGLMLAVASPLRGLIRSRVPQPGEGPSVEARTSGFWRADFACDGPAGTLVYTTGDRFDPGYGSTARMLGEAALCLARDPLDSPGGVQTPSIAMGNTLAERLRAAGLTFAPALP